ncbi:SDR family NAD(P)-dependent oxidoreductase [Zongyangia hominis]|uniref:SDR family oxidoreductase n=1 Tax=Zongyangia hominis TaxID=2763677 RepID=A0A926EEN0_9FIRM|nr:SDR family oxidoreductase [Zongyangia hominis]MBC8571054.1 SDR family oxidoreductase [Zongyangia hominis]
MKQSYKDRVAIVTGGGAGIGRAIAVALAQQGMHLVLCGRTVAKMEETVQMVSEYGVKTLICAGDLKEEDYLIRVVDETMKTFGRIDVLINNAGVSMAKPIVECTAQEFDDIMDTNARAPFLLCKYAIPHMKASDCGTIINIASVVGHKGYINQSIYGASKHALTGFTKVLAQEVQKDDIRVHLISPGGVYTEMVAQVRPDLDPTYLIKPVDIANIVTFLLESRGNAVIDSINVHRISNTPFI